MSPYQTGDFTLTWCVPTPRGETDFPKLYVGDFRWGRAEAAGMEALSRVACQPTYSSRGAHVVLTVCCDDLVRGYSRIRLVSSPVVK